MLVTIWFSSDSGELVSAILGGEKERAEEFWFGRGLAWAETGEGSSALRLSLLVDTAKIVARTKRRDREARFGVGFCDAYTFTACGLIAVFLRSFSRTLRSRERRGIEIELVAYPERPHSAEIAARLFLPLGYALDTAGGKLRAKAERPAGQALAELPALLLALDRRTRLFLDADELAELRDGTEAWVPDHPARRAIELALSGQPTPLRYLTCSTTNATAEENDSGSETHLLDGVGTLSSSLISSIALAPSQRAFARRAFSRVDIDPRWLLYLPSGIASLQGETARGELERPELAFDYFRNERIEKVVVEEKHMGSRGIVVLCRSRKAARDRFGIESEIPGIAYTRNARRFFRDEDTVAVFLDRGERVLTKSNFWTRFSTDWVLFDGEILPWAVKAAESSEESDLVTNGELVLEETESALESAAPSSLIEYWKEAIHGERAALQRYDSMFKRYRSETADLSALKFAPFHLLAVEGRTFFDKSHLWHMETLNRLARSGAGFIIPTRYELVETCEEKSWRNALSWWEGLSERGEEGFVVKPLAFVSRGRRGLAQPALKCRSREHLRLVYGPRYDSQEVHELLISRDALKSRRNKHRRILRQFALSIEAVTRFVQRSSLDAVYECVLGVLAQEVAPAMST